MSDQKQQTAPPFGLDKPMLSEVVAICLGVASATAPGRYGPILFAMSMVVAVFALWLLACTQWVSFNSCHVQFKKAVLAIFLIPSVLIMVTSITATFRAQEPKPVQFDVNVKSENADHQARAQNEELAKMLPSAPNDSSVAKVQLAEANKRLQALAPAQSQWLQHRAESRLLPDSQTRGQPA